MFFNTIYKVITEALFPYSKEEKELFFYTAEEAYKRLPMARTPPLADSYSVFAYKDKLVTKLVWNIKYKKFPKAIEIGGYALHRRLLDLTKSEIDPSLGNRSVQKIIVIPIPITSKRRKERGYNQCELLLDEMERLDTKSADSNNVSDNSVSNRFIYKKDLLLRVQHLSRQTLKNREERLESAKDIFEVNDIGSLKLEVGSSNSPAQEKNSTKIIGATVIVIDDVITTGSTMREAMDTLKRAGFREVRGLSLAH